MTEVASLFVKSGTNLEDKDSDAYTVSREALSIIASQPGYQHAYYGHHVEDRSKVDLVIGAYIQSLDSQIDTQALEGLRRLITVFRIRLGQY